MNTFLTNFAQNWDQSVETETVKDPVTNKTTVKHSLILANKKQIETSRVALPPIF